MLHSSNECTEQAWQAARDNPRPTAAAVCYTIYRCNDVGLGRNHAKYV